MSIEGFYLMPHPPIMIPEVGGDEVSKIQATFDSCMKISKEIESLKPDTIITITPHGVLFGDAVSISTEENISGNLSNFRAPEVYMDIPIDLELTSSIIKNANDDGIPIAGLTSDFLKNYNHKYELDHGSMVPLYFVNKHYTSYKLVHITYGMLSDIQLYRFGMSIKNSVEKTNKKVVFIASGDLSHRLKNEGPYSYSPAGKEFDETLLRLLQLGDIPNIFTMNSSMINDAGECGLKSIYILLGALNGYEMKGDLLSYEGPFGVGYGVMKLFNTPNPKDYFDEIKSIKAQKLSYKLSNSNPYVKLARLSLHHYFINGSIMDLNNDVAPELLDKRHGVFVSLKKNGQLRGCIGTILPTTSCVAEEIIRNAVQSATEDPRFNPVEESELMDIDISVDVLTDPEPCSKEDLDPKRYGVIVSTKFRRGLLLPDLDGVDTVEEQLKIACDKGGINSRENFDIQRFEVIRYKEGIN